MKRTFWTSILKLVVRSCEGGKLIESVEDVSDGELIVSIRRRISSTLIYFQLEYHSYGNKG